MYIGPVKQSTAQKVVIGPFVDATDGVTPEVSLSGNLTILKNGESDGTVALGTHVGNGVYPITFSTANTGTLGSLQVLAAPSGAVPRVFSFTVLTANAYNSIVLGSDYLQVDTMQIEGSDATDSLAYTATDVASDYTWHWTKDTNSTHSPKIVNVNPTDAYTLAFDLTNELNPDAGINSISSVTSSPSGITISNTRKSGDNRKVLFDIDGGQADGQDYTVTCTVTTTDSGTVVRTGTLRSSST